jgi:hypothetical protein
MKKNNRTKSLTLAITVVLIVRIILHGCKQQAI